MKKARIFNTYVIIAYVLLSSLVNFASHEENTLSALQVGEPNPIPRNPFSTAEGAPYISIKYDNNTYQGELRSASFSYGDVNDNVEPFEINSSNITSIIPEQAINISQNKQIELLIGGNPTPENQPNTLSATAYYVNGTEAKVLSIIEEEKKNKFLVDLEKGQYLILTVATWLPNPDNYLKSSGYVSYIFKVNIE